MPGGPNRRRRGDDRWWTFSFVALAVVALIAYVELQVRNEPPPVQYMGEPSGEAITACPGETVEYRVRVNVRRMPDIVNVVRTLWDREEGRIIGQSDVPPPVVWNVPGTTMDPAMPYRVPDGVEPGSYSLEVAIFGLSGRASALSVPFVVPESCAER